MDTAAEAAKQRPTGESRGQKAPDSAQKVPSKAAATPATTATRMADAQAQEERLSSMQVQPAASSFSPQGLSYFS